MSATQELARLASGIIECCSRVTVKKNIVKMLGTKSEELANLLGEASQSRLWSDLLEKLLQESDLLMKGILERVKRWSGWNPMSQLWHMSDIEKETGGFDRELDKSLAIMRYLSGTRIFPKPSSATGTRAQELFRRVLIYTSVVNRFLELRPRDDSSGSARVEENDSEEALTETPGEEAFEGESLLMQFEDSQRILAGLAPEMQKALVDALLGQLAGALKSRTKRKALQELKDDRAQLIIDFLYSVLLQPLANPRVPWLRKHTLIVLRNLSGASMLYPRWYVLRDIVYESPEDSGGFCDIHKGRYDTLELCLKVVRPQRFQLDRMLKIYAKEAILWGQLHHPNITPFYGIFYLDEAQKTICLVSPWMNNGNVVAYLQQNPVTPRKPLIRDIASGLKYLHDENIVHADLKGVNILVNDSGRACITDFGISTIWTDRTLGFTHTTKDVIGRTIPWSAPELVKEGVKPSRTSDIWAFGCVCYEILSRKLPFDECLTDSQIIWKLMAGTPPAQRGEVLALDTLDMVDGDMWDLMNSCWSPEPGERPSCKQICQQLELEGLVSTETEDEAQARFVQESRYLQLIVGKNSDVKIDMVKVGEILAGL